MAKKSLFVFVCVLVMAVGPAFGAAKADKVRTVGGNRSWYNVYDEDDMSSDSATGFPTQQSVREFVKNVAVINFPLAGAMVDASGPVLATTAPNLARRDSVPAIIWDNSGEVLPVAWSFLVPTDSFTTVTFYAMVSSDDASGAGTWLDWAIIQNADDSGFGGKIAQDTVECTSASLAVSNEVLTLTPDATAAAQFVAGSLITLEVFNASTNNDALELKAVWGVFQ